MKLAAFSVVFYIVSKLGYSALMNHHGELYYNDYIRIAFFAVQYVAFLGLTYGVLRAAVTRMAKSFLWGVIAFFGALLISHVVYLFCPTEAEIVMRNGMAVIGLLKRTRFNMYSKGLTVLKSMHRHNLGPL